MSPTARVFSSGFPLPAASCLPVDNLQRFCNTGVGDFQTMPPNKNPKLGKYLLKARQAKGLSLRELQELSGVEYSLINRMERGELGTPDPAKLVKLARALDVDIEDIYAMAGYTVPEGLPELAPYLRAKYDLPDTAVGEIERYFERLKKRYERESMPRKRGGGGKSAR